jgi:hypothetical protein
MIFFEKVIRVKILRNEAVMLNFVLVSSYLASLGWMNFGQIEKEPSSEKKEVAQASENEDGTYRYETSNGTTYSGVAEPSSGYAHLIAFGDFLYWKTSVSGLPYAATGVGLTIPDVISFVENQRRVRNIHFSHDPGFRVGLGFQIDRGWDLTGRWTHFHTKASSRVLEVSPEPGDPRFISLIWALFPGRTVELCARQKMHFDQVDVNFAKNIYLGRHFLFNPFFGALGARINQRLRIHSSGFIDGELPTTQDTTLRNNFRGAGIQVGAGTEFAPIRWVSLYGKGSYGLVYGKFNLKRNDLQLLLTDTGTISIPHQEFSRLENLVSTFDIIAGLKLSAYSRNQKIRLTGHISYEAVFWPNQVRIQKYVIQGDPAQTFPLLGYGDVGFQGLTAGLELRF